MYVKRTVFYFLVIFFIDASVGNAADNLNLERVFRTPKDFSRVNFDHFEILERNNFDCTPAKQQSEVTNDDVPPTVPDQPNPKTVANAQVLLRFGGDDIRGKNRIETPNKPYSSPVKSYPPQSHIPQFNEMSRYPSPYFQPSYQTLPYFPPPPPAYGYPYPPYSFPGSYYPRPEYGRVPHGVYQGQLYPGNYLGPYSQEGKNFLGNGASENTSANHPKITTTTDLTDDVIPECQKCNGNSMKSPVAMNPSYQQDRPNEYYGLNSKPTSFSNYTEGVLEPKIILVEPTAENIYRQPSFGYPTADVVEKFPDFLNKKDLVEPEWFGVTSTGSQNANGNNNRPTYPMTPTGIQYRPGKFPEFIKKEDFIEPERTKNIHSKCNHHACNSHGNHPNENNDLKFPEFIKKEDLVEPDWSVDVDPPKSKCHHPHHSCQLDDTTTGKQHDTFSNSMKEKFSQESGKIADFPKKANPYYMSPDFIKKEDLVESEQLPEFEKEEGNVRSAAISGLITKKAEEAFEKVSGIIKKKEVLQSSNIPISVTKEVIENAGKVGQFMIEKTSEKVSHIPEKIDLIESSRIPQFLKEQDLVEPEWNIQDGKYENRPNQPSNPTEVYPITNNHDRHPESIKDTDIAETSKLSNIVKQTPTKNEELKNPGKLPDFLKKEDLIEPGRPGIIPEGKCNHHNPHHSCHPSDKYPNKPDRFPDFIKNEDFLEDIPVEPSRSKCDHRNPHHTCHSTEKYPNENRPDRFPNFIKEEDLMEPTWPGDINIKPSKGKCNYPNPNHSCHSSGKYPNENKPGRFPNFIKEEDLVEPTWPGHITIKPAKGKCNHPNPNHSCHSSGKYLNENKPGRFPEFIKEEDFVEPEHIPVKPPRGKCDHYSCHPDEKKPDRFPDFIKKEDLIEPEWPEDIDVKPHKCDSCHSSVKNEPDFMKEENLAESGKSVDFTKKEDLVEPEKPSDFVRSPTNFDEPGTKKFPDFLKKEDFIEADTPGNMDSVTSTKDGRTNNGPELPSTPIKEEPNSKVQQQPSMYLLPMDKPLDDNVQIKPMVINIDPQSGPGVLSSIQLQGVKHEPNITEIQGWLNKSLVPYVCKVCGHKPKLLVSYPLKPTRVQPEEDISISGCQCCRQNGFCNCCNCLRDPNIPFGHRFPSDIDSLLQVSRPFVQCEDRLPRFHRDGRRPGEYSAGYSISSGSTISSSMSQIGDQRPKVYVNGYRTSEGSGYYSDPTRDVFYQKPKVLDFIRTPSPYLPVIQHTRVEEPDWYSVVPKYDIVPKKITPIDIPDLVPTDVFVCKQCNNPHHRGIVCHREYVPRDVIETEPIVRYPLKRFPWGDIRNY